MKSVQQENWNEAAPGYSLGVYYDEQTWNAIGAFLRGERLSRKAVIWILLSKHMRWASTGDRTSLSEFKDYYTRHHKSIMLSLRDAGFLLGDKTIAFVCPEHGDSAKYSPQDHEAYCLDREEVLDLNEPAVIAAIKKAYADKKGAR